MPFAAALVLVAAGLAMYACGGSVYTATSSEDCYRVIRFAALLFFEHMKDKLQCSGNVLLTCQTTCTLLQHLGRATLQVTATQHTGPSLQLADSAHS